MTAFQEASPQKFCMYSLFPPSSPYIRSINSSLISVLKILNAMICSPGFSFCQAQCCQAARHLSVLSKYFWWEICIRIIFIVVPCILILSLFWFTNQCTRVLLSKK
jgi:hypothetical protein